MSDAKSALLGRLAVERGYVSAERLDEARRAQVLAAEAAGARIGLAEILLGKGWLTPDQAQELADAAAAEAGGEGVIGAYEVVAKLGQGGMGAVYKAKHTETGRCVALKILPPSLATEDLVKRFRREAEIVAGLDHENIVGCTEFGYDAARDCHYCALELVEGETLQDRVEREGRLSEDDALSIASQITRALLHANANGLIHRDVKPENIMVTPDGTAKLLDLGLARPASLEATRFTQTGVFIGSLYYASPEQARIERELDIRSDIYSFGATLYHVVTGRPPFEGSTAVGILQKHVFEKPRWPAEVNPALSDGICRVIMKMMAKDPADRYQAPGELLADLELLREGKEPAFESEAAGEEPEPREMKCFACGSELQLTGPRRAKCSNPQCSVAFDLYLCEFCESHTVTREGGGLMCLNPSCRMFIKRRAACPECNKISRIELKGNAVCLNRRCSSNAGRLRRCPACEREAALSLDRSSVCLKGHCSQFLIHRPAEPGAPEVTTADS